MKAAPPAPPQVTAVVLTHRRPRLATAVVRGLIEREGFPPARVVLVVNGEGGLADRALEASIRVVRLRENLGPAGGFRQGLIAAFGEPSTEWAYLCEDDVGLFELPMPRVGRVLDAAQDQAGAPVGAVVAYGRRLAGRTGHTEAFTPPTAEPALQPVDVAAWGATLVSRSVVDAGVLPDADLFFGYEDFDFFFTVRRRGFSVMVDAVTARAVAPHMTLAGRDSALSGERPLDSDESWRAYYLARNFTEIARRHGERRWIAWHLAYSVRRMQLASSGSERKATLIGLWDGARRRLGPNTRFMRTAGEWDTAGDA